MWRLAQLLGALAALGGLALLMFTLNRSPAKVAWELAASSRTSRQIAETARRRIQGRGMPDYPRSRHVEVAPPIALLSTGAAVAVLATVMAPTAGSTSGTDDDVQASDVTLVSGRTTNKTLDLIVRSGPRTEAKRLGALKPDTLVTIACAENGLAVRRDGRVESVWYRLEQPIDGWVASAYIYASAEVAPC